MTRENIEQPTVDIILLYSGGPMKLLVVALESAFVKILWASNSSFNVSDIFCAIEEVGFN